MKRFLITALAALAFVLPSCDDNDSSEPTPVGPDPVEVSVPTPVAWSDEQALAPDQALGVTLSLKDAQTNNIVFTCQPGESALSYRLDVYPVAVLYNSLFEAFKDRIRNGETISEEEVNQQILTFLFSQEGSGGYIMSAKQVAENGGDYSEMTFDWANTQFNQIHFVPNSEYVVVAVGCTDEDGNNGSWESMSMLHIKTPGAELIGEPKASIEIVPSFTTFKVQVHPNADAKIFYMAINDTEQFDEFEQYYGAAILKDYICNFMSAPYDATLEESELRYTFPVGNPDPEKSLTVITVAADENGMVGEMIRRDFNLLSIPEETQTAGVVMTVDEVAATAVRFKIEMDKNTNLAAFKVVSKAEYEAIDFSDSVAMAVMARDIIETGWAAQNKNFRDSAGCVAYEGFYEVSAGSELVALYAGRNAYTQASEVKALPFTTKPLVKDNAAAATATINLTFSEVTRTSWHCDFAVENAAVIYFQYLMTDEIFTGTGDSKELNQAAATAYLLSGEGNHVPTWMEHSYPFAGMDPAKDYVFAYMAQGWDGILTEVKLATVTTEAVEGGMNPTMELNGFVDESKNFNCEFNIKSDVVKYYCCIIPDEYTRQGFTKEECIELWTAEMLSEAQNYSSVRYSAPTAGKKRLVALCLPIGQNPETKEEVTGELQMLFWDEASYKEDIAVDPNNVRAGVRTADKIFN